MKTEGVEPFRRLPGTDNEKPDKWNPERSCYIGSFPNVSPEKEDNKGDRKQDAMVGERCIGYIRGQRSEERGRRTEGGGWSCSSAMFRQLDYLPRIVIRFLKETANGLSRVSNHLFRHFGKDRQR